MQAIQDNFSKFARKYTIQILEKTVNEDDLHT